MLTQAVLLVGGFGTRLGALTTLVPKPLLPVGGRPFLDYLIAHLRAQGVTRFILLAGHLGEQVCAYRDQCRAVGLDVEVVVEPEPAGTGGALRCAAEYLDDVFLLSNGDSLLDVDVAALAGRFAGDDWLGKIALRRVDDAGRYGAVVLNGPRIAAFAERGAPGPGLINGGIYILRKPVLDRIGSSPCSIERDVFPVLATEGCLAGLATDGYFIDIGIPEDYDRAHREIPSRFRNILLGAE